MTIVRRPSPLGELVSLRQAMDRLFEDSFVRPHPFGIGFSEGVATLPLDITSTADALIVDAGPAFNGRGAQDAFVVAQGRATKTRIELGLGDGNAVEIVAGAALGDTLVVSDIARYKHLNSIRVTD